MGEFYIFLFSLLILQIPHPSFQSTVENGTFCYEDSPTCGQKSLEWPGICQSGKHQSPINLPHNLATIASAALIGRPLTFKGYRSSHFYIRNNGHSIQVSFTPDLSSTSKMSGYGFTNDYIFAQAHFHWGKNVAAGGSEHTINGEHVPMELHIVHYNSKYPNFTTAAAASSDSKALAVVAVFIAPHFERFEPNPAFHTIAKNAPNMYQPAPQLINEPLDLNNFLPLRGDTLYRYLGSLTTPGCTENVEWTVDPDTVIVQLSDYWKFHNVRDEANLALRENYRAVQPLNDRQIQVFHKSD